MNQEPTYKKCSIKYCPNAHYAQGLCTRHYANWRRNQLIVPGNDARTIMALCMNLMKSYVPTSDYNQAIDEALESVDHDSDVPTLAGEFEKLLIEKD